MTVISLVFFCRNDHMGQDLSPFQIHTARSQIKLFYRNGSFSVSIFNTKKGVQRKYCRRTVCTDCTIADVSSNRTDITDLRTSNLIYCFSKDRNTFLYDRIICNMRKRGACTDINISVFFFTKTKG